MTWFLVLRILAVAAMGWVCAHAIRVLVEHGTGARRQTRRDLLGELLTGLGAFGIGWGWLPGGLPGSGDVCVLVGTLAFALGLVVQRGSPPN